MERKEQITIVVPIYNVEKYLEKCLYSIINQTYRNLEIILVNDGSTDSSNEICDYIAIQDKRVRVIHKKNGGLSDARNVGLNASTSNYICFIDSDDYIELNMIEVLYNNLCEYNADISICSFTPFKEGEELTKSQSKLEQLTLFESKTALSELYGLKSVEFTVSWNKLYKVKIFENILFPVGKFHEDEFTTYKLFIKSNKIIYTSLPLYFYLQREGSITSIFSEKRMHIIDAYIERLKIAQKIDIDFYNTTYTNFLNILIEYYFKYSDLNKVDLSTDIFQCYKKYFNFNKVRSLSYKRKIRFFLFKVNPKIYKYIIKKMEILL